MRRSLGYLTLFALLAVSARHAALAQPVSRSVTVKGQQDATPLFTQSGGIVTWKCSTGMTCSWANGVFTMMAGAGVAVSSQIYEAIDAGATPSAGLA